MMLNYKSWLSFSGRPCHGPWPRPDGSSIYYKRANAFLLLTFPTFLGHIAREKKHRTYDSMGPTEKNTKEKKNLIDYLYVTLLGRF